MIGFGQGRCPKRKSDFIQPFPQVVYSRTADNEMCSIGNSQQWPERTFYSGKMVSGKVADFVRHASFRDISFPDIVCQIARVNSHRAGSGTKSIHGAGLFACVYIFFFESSQSSRIFPASTKPGDFPLRNDTLSCGKRKTG